jgi:hypothetical protein
LLVGRGRLWVLPGGLWCWCWASILAWLVLALPLVLTPEAALVGLGAVPGAPGEWGHNGPGACVGPARMVMGRVWDQGYGVVWSGTIPCIRKGEDRQLKSEHQTL